LIFDCIFWPIEAPLIGLVRESATDHKVNSNLIDLGRALLLHNFWARSGFAALEAILVGDCAEMCVGQPDAIIRDSILNFMEETICSGAKNRCTCCKITRWEEEPFSQCAYSNQRVGSCDAHLNALMLSEWGGTLIFAGEATDIACQGSCHGAIFSGIRAAEEVCSVMASEGWP